MENKIWFEIHATNGYAVAICLWSGAFLLTAGYFAVVEIIRIITGGK